MFVPSPPASLKVACAHDTVRSPARVVNLRSNRLLPKQQHAVHHICTCHMQQRRCSMLAAASLADAPSTSGTHTGGIATRVATFALSLSIAASSAFGWWAPVAHAASETGAKAIAEYVELQHKGKLNSNKQIDDFRQKYNIRRTFDGRVQVRARGGEWFSARLDMEMPGAVLLRDAGGAIYALETDGLVQIDLSDDYVLFMMFADGEWEGEMQPVDVEGDGGKVKQLTLGEKEFREVIGILKEDDGESEKE